MRPNQGYHALYNVPLSDVRDFHFTILESLEVEWVIVISNWNHVVFHWTIRRELVITQNHDDWGHYPCNKINNETYLEILSIFVQYLKCLAVNILNSMSIFPLNVFKLWNNLWQRYWCLSTFIKTFIAARVWSYNNNLNKEICYMQNLHLSISCSGCREKWVLLV